MKECKHCWYDRGEGIKICILCRSIKGIGDKFKIYSKEEFEEMYKKDI